MLSAPEIRKRTLPRVTMRSLILGCMSNMVVRSEYMAGRMATRRMKLATELIGIKKLAYIYCTGIVS
jgi:hypothetical protein